MTTWSFIPSQYIQNAIKNTKSYSQKSNQKLISFAPSPFNMGYWTETDTSSILGSVDSSYFQSLIGTLQWIMELGRIDVKFKATMMAMPQKGHLEQLYCIFSYLKNKHNSEIVLIQPFMHLKWINSQGMIKIIHHIPNHTKLFLKMLMRLGVLDI